MTLCANNTPSTNEYTGNGVITEYSITFQYYSQSDIFVAFYDTAAEAWVSVSNSNWSFLNPTVIKFNTAPADNQRILIYRCTDIDPLPAEFFPGNSIKAADLNNNFFVMKSAIEEINTQAGSSDTLAQSAKATADAANTKADTAIATANTASTNASSAVTTANTADTNATAAVNTANTALSSANTAVSTANTANTTASAANTTANTADTKADTAIATANSASTAAGTALTNSQAAVTTANTADTNATTALNTANSVASVANTANTNATNAVNTANTALSTANTANTTANNADTAATAAVSSANAAVTTANTADTNATTALNTANTADTNANTALSTSNTAYTAATTAFNTANAANTTANNALSTANAANTTANNALNQVSAASPWSESSGVVSLVNSGSNVGVGTASTTARVTVNSNTATGNINLADFIAPAANANALVRMIIRNAANNGTTSVDFYKQYQSGFGIHNTDTDPSNFTRFIVGASERMRITSGGNCGINNSTPSFKLDVDAQIRAGSSTGYGFLALGKHPSDAYKNWHIASEGNGYLSFFNGNDGSGSKRVTIGSNGNFGIGTSNPSTLLHLADGSLTLDSGGNNGFSRTVIFRDDVNFGTQVRASDGAYIATTYAVNHNATGALDHKWYTGAASEKLRLTSSGNLGVNTSTPPARLTVTAGASSATAYAGRSLNYGALVHTVSGRSGYIVQNTNAFTTANDNAGFQWLYPFNSGGDSNYKVFRSAAGTTLVDKFWVNQGGGAYFANNVGIGTVSPNNLLDVRGASDPQIKVSATNTGTNSAGLYIENQGQRNWQIWADRSSDQLRIGHNSRASTVVSITDTKVGIGASQPLGKLHVRPADEVNFVVRDESTAVVLSAETNSGRDNNRLMAFEGSYFNFTTSGSEKVRITPSGALGIGESNPGHKLVVRGNAVFGPKNSSDQYQGVSFINGKDSGAGVTTTFLDFRNNFGVPDTHIFTDHNTDGSSTIILGTTAAGARNTDRRSEKMRILGDGRVGVGVSNPNYKLDVLGSFRFGQISGYGLIQYGHSTTNNNNWHAGSDGAGSFVFYNGVTGSGIEKMRITSSGVTIPGNLTVNGTINGNTGGGGGGGGGGGYKNVKTDFGATGNGTTDDTTAVRNALNSGGTIYFPEGTYRITSTLYHTSAFNVVGDGQQSRIMFDAGVNDQNLFNLETNVRHNNDKKWSFSSIALSCKAVANRIHASGIRIAYTGSATVIGGTNYLELNDVHIVSEITTDATQAYFKYGLATVNIGGIVADNLNISSFNVNCENDTNTVGIYIQNNIEGHAVIRAFTGNNIYLQRYYKGLHATKIGGGQNIESIYMTQGEIVCNKGIDLAASHATFINGMHIECQRESYINTSDGGPHRVVGCDLRGGRNGTQNFTDYIIKIGVDNCSFTGNYITAQMPSAGCIKTGGSVGNPDNVSIVGNIFNGNGSSTYRALSCESGSANVLFNGNLGSGFGGNSNPVFNQIGSGQGKLNNTTNEFQ